ncbi:hypothetical protein QS257_19560 [Terrilactibacillus sp. S3-3]|nr:hypothetical protein QS257_19560 [Terrilactibacillus sp. S3-3]
MPERKRFPLILKKNKRDGEGFIIIEIERKNGRYTSLLNNAGAAVSYPPGLSEGQEVVPGIIFNLDKKIIDTFFIQKQSKS